MQRLIVLLFVALILISGCGAPHQFSGSVIDPPKSVTDWIIPDQHGQPFQLDTERGKVTLLYFGYTNCPDFCPPTMGDWKQLRQLLGTQADDVRFVMISIDPQRDTEQVLAQFLERFDPTFVGLRPTASQLAGLSKEYGLGLTSHAEGDANGNHQLPHGTHTYVLDQSGDLRLLFSSDVDVSGMSADIKQLLRSS